MAGSSVIGALRVVIGADTAALDKGLKGAQSQLSRFSTGIKNAGLVAAGAFAGALGGAGVAIRNTLKDMDQLGKMSQSIGIPVEELSKLKYAAELSDVSLESLGKSVIKLSRNMSEVAGGNATGAAAQAFKVLGISVRNTDGTMKSSAAVMDEVANRFAQYQDGANKTALAVALFGRAGAEMIPLLNQGAAAIKAAKDEAEEFGLVVDKKTAQAAETFNDNLTRLSRMMTGVFVKVTAASSDTLANLTNTMVDAARAGGNFEGVASALSGVMKVLASTVLLAANAVNQFSTYFGALISAAQKVGSFDFSGAFNDLKQGAVDVGQNFEELRTKLTEVWAPPQSWTDWRQSLQASNDAIREAIGLGNQFVDMRKRDAPALPQGGENALQSYLSGIEKRKAALTAEVQTIGMSEQAQESARIKLEALTIAKEKNIVVTDAMRAKIETAAQSFGALSQQLQEARQRWAFVENSINTVASGLTDVATGTKTAKEAFAEMAKSIIRDFIQMTIKAQLFRAASSFMGGFGGFGGGYNTSLTGGNPFPTPLAFAQGGSFVVPGAGGIDSQMATMRLTPGERVSVTKDGGYPGGAPITYAPVIDARGVDGAQLTRLEQIMARDKAEFATRVIAVNRDARNRRAA